MFVIQDKRYHIVEELYRNEREYVEALGVLKEVSCLGLIVRMCVLPCVGGWCVYVCVCVCVHVHTCLCVCVCVCVCECV